jgi:hypothetical protein
MNKIKALGLLSILFSVNHSIADELGLDHPDFKPINALKSYHSGSSELNSLSNKIKGSLETSQKCSSTLINNIKNLTSNRGLADEAHFFLGICKELDGDNGNAIQEYKASLNLKKSNKEAVFRLAYLNLLNKNYQDTLNLSDEALWMNYENPTLPKYLKAVSYSMLNNLDNAKKNLDDLEKNNSKFLPALGLRRKLLVEEIAKTSDPSKKKALRDSYNQLLPKLLANEPQNKSYSLEYARTLLSIGHPLHNPNALNQGLAIIRKFSRVNNQVDDAFLLLEIQFLEQQGKFTEAKGILDQLASANPLSPGIEYKRIELTTKLNPDSAPE